MRGARLSSAFCALVFWIIPAYAGSTMLMAVTALVDWDHPRVCGEHCNGIVDKVKGLGSSPRMRGALPGLFSTG